jgi:hypothetical protein
MYDVPIRRARVFLGPSPSIFRHGRKRLLQNAPDRLSIRLIARNDAKARGWNLVVALILARGSRFPSTDSFQSFHARHGHLGWTVFTSRGCGSRDTAAGWTFDKQREGDANGVRNSTLAG